MEDLIPMLASTSLFRCFSTKELSMLFEKEHYRVKQYAKNAVIHFQNEKCVSLDIVLRGTVLVQKIDSNGDMLTLCSFMAGDSIGENLLFSHNNPYPMTMTAKYDTDILHADKELILSLCQSNSGFLENFLQSIFDKTLILAGKIQLLSMKTIRQCMIEFLLYECRIQKNTTIRLEVSKKELAEKLGVQRPSLSRELKKMRNENLIAYDAKSITIINIEALKRLHTE
jgi:CRP-like cAMP-binding protein